MKMKAFILLMGMLVSQLVFAGNEGGGGGSMVLVDNKWTLADYFGEHTINSEDPLYLDGNPLEAMKLLIRVLGNYSLAPNFVIETLEKIVIVDGDFRFVKKLPCQLSEVSGQDAHQYGCTKDGVTYLIKELFEKLSNNDRLFALLHERLHTLDSSDKAHQWILPYIYAGKILYDRLEKQLAGDESLLNQAEMRVINRMIDINVNTILKSPIAPRSNFEGKEQVLLVRAGGIILSSCYFSPDIAELTRTFIGVGSRITRPIGCRLDSFKNSKLIRSTLYKTNVANSTLINSDVSNLSEIKSLISNSKLTNSEIKAWYYIFAPAIEKGIIIKESIIENTMINVDVKVGTVPSSLIEVCRTTITNEIIDQETYKNCL